MTRTTPARQRILHLAAALAILASALAAGFYQPLLTWLGERLVSRDTARAADAIVVLAGEHGERVREGVRLWREGWAPHLVMSGGPGEADIPLSTLMRRQAEALGVPRTAISEQDRSTDTGEDATFTAALLRARAWHRVLLVTSPYHARRARWLFRRELAGSNIEVLSCPARESWFSPHRWWTRKADRKAVLLEYFKGAWYLLGPS